MRIKTLLAGASLAAGLAMGASANAATTLVDVSALNGVGTIVNLAAATYTINEIGIAQGGAYNSWSPWSGDSGCDGAGMNCSQGWTGGFAIDFGHGSGAFDRVDGTNYGQKAIAGNNYIWASDLQALASIQAGPLVGAPLPQATQVSAYVAVGNPITFTLASAQAVNFFIFDSPYGDNRGGVSLSVSTPTSAVPEPAVWAMMLMGFGGLGAAMRSRRKTVATFA